VKEFAKERQDDFAFAPFAEDFATFALKLFTSLWFNAHWSTHTTN